MASRNEKSPGDRRYGRYYKYESIRFEWRKFFEENHPRQRYMAEDFFKNFFRNHRGFQFVIAEIFDGTTHPLVSAEKFADLKNELERKTGQSLPEVSNTSDVKVKEERRSFSDLHTYINFSKSLKAANDQIKVRRRKDAEESVRELRTFLQRKPNARAMAIDIETYENDHSKILEIGSFTTSLASPEGNEQAHHVIITENLHMVNKDYVSDNRDKFRFGTSQHMSLAEAAGKFSQYISDADILVTHSGGGDEFYLAKNGMSLEGKPMFDTQLLGLALLTDEKNLSVFGLKRLMGDLGISYDEDILHNAGNDSYYTMKVFLALKKKL
ncbi:uncharacterized protein [Pocillopora verrucosa]|uniref:uncharacterized protein n=1 Tax=Pocillopora verrucosa TaxID=203993 RepID=UPI0027971012|nr:uncharacterized protein LOC131796435 [Pocillopora verrucosa]